MALNTFKSNYLTPLHFKGLKNRQETFLFVGHRHSKHVIVIS